MFEQRVMQMFYDRATTSEDLPWHDEEPPPLLLDAARAVQGPKTALDLGCGAGVHAVTMAKLGFRVTAVDVMPKALEFGRERASQSGVEIEWVEHDLLAWRCDKQFSLIFDSGTLHNFTGSTVSRYRDQLLSWMAVGSSFVLAHWGKRHWLDWRPIGPRRRSREHLVRLFSPALVEHDSSSSEIEGVPLPIGPTVRGQCIWFRRVQ